MPTAPLPAAPLITTAWRTASRCAFLTYIGLGLPVTIPSLGNLINEGKQVMLNASLVYQLYFPAIVISIITIAFYMIGNAFSDAADPRNHV